MPIWFTSVSLPPLGPINNQLINHWIHQARIHLRLIPSTGPHPQLIWVPCQFSQAPVEQAITLLCWSWFVYLYLMWNQLNKQSLWLATTASSSSCLCLCWFIGGWLVCWQIWLVGWLVIPGGMLTCCVFCNCILYLYFYLFLYFVFCVNLQGGMLTCCVFCVLCSRGLAWGATIWSGLPWQRSPAQTC